jgi:hypothetical protein
MQWLDHSRDFPSGSHALFSPSNPSWRNDESVEDVLKRYYARLAAPIGTAVHEEARDCILTQTKYTKNEAKKALTKKLLLYPDAHIPRSAFDADFLAENFVNYVNDALGYMMQPEQPLYYSKWCAGTADTIIFEEKKRILRIHDLKTGVMPAKFLQLEFYAALFFLEYGKMLNVNPGDTQIQLRIYQAGEVKEEYPTAEDIVPLMDCCIWHTDVMRKAEEE